MYIVYHTYRVSAFQMHSYSSDATAYRIRLYTEYSLLTYLVKEKWEVFLSFVSFSLMEKYLLPWCTVHKAKLKCTLHSHSYYVCGKRSPKSFLSQGILYTAQYNGLWQMPNNNEFLVVGQRI